jgi:hypothetical protein
VLVADGIADEAFAVELADDVAVAVWEGYLGGLRPGLDRERGRRALCLRPRHRVATLVAAARRTARVGRDDRFPATASLV